MKISVKMLQRQECVVDVSPDTTVAGLKKIVSTILNIPTSEQKLLLLGKTLSDGKVLKDCGVTEGCKLNLIRRPATETSAPSQSCSSPGTLREEMLKFLLRQDMSASNALKLVDAFMKEFHRSVNALSLDDIERIAKARIQEENANA